MLSPVRIVKNSILSFVRLHNYRSFSGHKNMAAAQQIASYFQLPQFVVVGASKDRTKFGNKVLRCYQAHNKRVSPIHPKETSIENVACKASLTDIAHDLSPQSTGVSIITPPPVTLKVLQEGVKLGFTHFFLQPGTYDAAVDSWIHDRQAHHPETIVIKSCVLVELGCDDDF